MRTHIEKRRRGRELTVKVDNDIPPDLAVLERCSVADLHAVRDDAVVELDAVRESVSNDEPIPQRLERVQD